MEGILLILLAMGAIILSYSGPEWMQTVVLFVLLVACLATCYKSRKNGWTGWAVFWGGAGVTAALLLWAIH